MSRIARKSAGLRAAPASESRKESRWGAAGDTHTVWCRAPSIPARA